ncbi:hypothetical protein CHH28_11410 [Bacterioplanes sanyensis]|uniref:Cation/H+ exchanger transmembrane domain-containing protein n=1 Tax=Bacterioplanes sanyensis TaxID=1249553 RepID=A0A222FKX1_9GAMM|nr:sodium:proton antiporter [Bacterioplanes sanyensis]ASP39246.1 hypothetical protein CHH28_11410 [Bacterioplanes sanyensis]
MTESIILILAAALFGYGLIARKIEKEDITAPMLFVALGIIVGPLMLGWVEPSLASTGLQRIAELTLALVLFTEASQIERQQLWRYEAYPIRLLAIGLPLTVVCGAVVAFYWLQLDWYTAAILAVILTPTDAALAQSIMNKRQFDEQLRHSIAVESGLNDGIALPILLLFLALLAAAGEQDAWRWADFIGTQLILGALLGIAAGRLGGMLIDHAILHHWMPPLYQRLSSVALGILAYLGSEALGGNGFVAVFLAGLFLQSERKRVMSRLKEFGEAEGHLLSLVIFFLFGAIFVSIAWPLLTWAMLCYALLSLTVIRMLPVAISLIGTPLSASSRAFLAWFGPRGIASILYLLLTLEQLGYDAHMKHYDVVFGTSVLTILLSILLHGLTAGWWSSIAARCERRHSQTKGSARHERRHPQELLEQLPPSSNASKK